MNGKNTRLILSILAILVPYVILVIQVSNAAANIIDLQPVWGDEQWWWQQANAVVEYGKPLGYWGYNGSCAPIGTFGTWGPAMLIPYALFGKIFGWNQWSYAYANVFYLGLATLIFIRLTRISNKKILLLVVCNLFIVVKNYFILTAMMECVRYALGIIALALLWFLYENPNCKYILKFFLIPFYLLYISQAYMIFSLFFFFYFLCILRDKKRIICVAASGIGTVVITVLSKLFFTLFSAPYIKVAEESSLLKKLLKSMNIIKSVSFESNIFFSWFMLTYFVLIIGIIIKLFMKRRDIFEKDEIIYFTSLTVLVAFFVGHIVFYSNMSEWTLIRGLTVGLTIVVFLLCLSNDKIIVNLFLMCAIIGIPTYNVVRDTFVINRFTEVESQVKDDLLKEELEKLLVINEQSTTPWENTIADYTQGRLNVAMLIPVGMSVNYMLDVEIPTFARYAILDKTEYAYTLVTNLEQNGYVLKLENETIMIMENESLQQMHIRKE